MNKEERIQANFFCLIKVIGIVAIIYTNINECFWYYSDMRYWATANVMETVLYCGPPMLFMLLGPKLMDIVDRVGWKRYLIHTVGTAAGIYVIWSLAGLLYRIAFLQELAWSDITMTIIADGLLHASLVNSYWLFLPMFAIMLAVPVLAAVPWFSRKKVFIYVIVLLLLTNCIFPSLMRYTGKGTNNSFGAGYTYEYLLFSLIGYMVVHYPLKKKYRQDLYLAGAAAFLLHLLGTYFLSRSAGEISRVFKSYMDATSVLYATAVFVSIYYAMKKHPLQGRLESAIHFLSRYAYPAYLSHWLISRMLLKHFHWDYRRMVYRLGAPILIIVLSVLMTEVFRHIELLEKLFPETFPADESDMQ